MLFVYLRILSKGCN